MSIKNAKKNKCSVKFQKKKHFMSVIKKKLHNFHANIQFVKYFYKFNRLHDLLEIIIKVKDLFY